MSKYFYKNGVLNVAILLHYFYAYIHRILADSELWLKFPKVCFTGFGGTRTKPGIKDTRTNTINHINIVWYDSESSEYPFLPISIDIVAGLPFPDWSPPWTRTHSSLHRNGCFMVAKRSDHIPMIERDQVARFSFSWSECEVLLGMPQAMRQGYMLAKHMRLPSICPIIAYPGRELTPISKVISSYILKNIIMNELHRNKKTETEDITNERIMHAKRIYSCLEDALKKRHLSMFFIPDQNLLSTFSEEDIKLSILYCKLMKQLLNDPNCVNQACSPPFPLPRKEI